MSDPAITAEALGRFLLKHPQAGDGDMATPLRVKWYESLARDVLDFVAVPSLVAEVERLSGVGKRSVPLSDVGRLLERVLGIPGEDWKVERWDSEYEGWSGTLRPTCVCDCDGCFCCDGMNLSADDMALIDAAFTDEGDE